jgi:hypothetical protein
LPGKSELGLGIAVDGFNFGKKLASSPPLALVFDKEVADPVLRGIVGRS